MRFARGGSPRTCRMVSREAVAAPAVGGVIGRGSPRRRTEARANGPVHSCARAARNLGKVGGEPPQRVSCRMAGTTARGRTRVCARPFLPVRKRPGGPGACYAVGGRRRRAFFSDWFRFCWIRRACEAGLGRVRLRGFGGGRRASAISRTKRSMQSARLRPWDRKRDDRIARMPSLETREPRARRRRLLCPSSRDGLLRTSKRSSARVLTRLTFCPPGPGLAVKRKRSSRSGIARPECMRMSFTEPDREIDSGTLAR